MQSFPNIEKSALRRGEYVGYADGVWRITKSNSSFGTWSARHLTDFRAPLLFAFRLKDMSEKLQEYERTQP